MPTREKLLGIGLTVVVGVWFLGPLAYATLFGPFVTRADELKQLRDTHSKKQAEALAVVRSKKELADARARSLPIDRNSSPKRPDAVDGQRLYQEWLTDLAKLSGLENIVVKPFGQRPLGPAGVYLSVPVTITAEARFAELTQFLQHFYRTDLLHRVTRLIVESRDAEGDPLMRVQIDAEGLALAGTPWRRSLFPVSSLVDPISSGATELVIATPKEFAVKVPFRIRVESELMLVTSLTPNGTATVIRGVERTKPADHAAGTEIELAPIRPGVSERSDEAVKELLAANVFIKPQKPVSPRLRIAPIAEKSLQRGEVLDFKIGVSGHDPAVGTPEFVLRDGAPPGLTLDAATGQVRWTPADDHPAGKFPVQVIVRHPHAPEGEASLTFSIVVRETNRAPQIGPVTVPTAYLGRPWKLPLPVSDPESKPEQLTVTFGTPAVEGLTYDAATQTLQWTPGDTIVVGPQTVQVTVADAGTPPKSATTTLTIPVDDDRASFTFLVGTVEEEGSGAIAWLFDRSQNRKQVVKVGDDLSIADVTGVVQAIERAGIVIERDGLRFRLALGKNLRQLEPVRTATIPPTSSPTGPSGD